MANFDRLHHWERFVPHLANNRELPAREQLALEIATGLSVLELEAFGKAQAAALEASRGEMTPDPGPEATDAARLAWVTARRAERERVRSAQAAHLGQAWAPFIRLAPGSHTINGKPLTSLADYLAAIASQQGAYNFLELRRQVMTLNSIDGAEALFSGRASGGSDGTQSQSNEQEGSGTGGR